MANISIPSSASQVSVMTPGQYAQSQGFELDDFGMSDNFWASLGDFFGSGRSEARAMYDNYLLANERAYEQAKLHDARLWESMKYQIASNDLIKAGLNPWLAVQSGLSGSSGNVGNSASTSSSSATSNKFGKDNSSSKSANQATNMIKDIANTAIKVAGLMYLVG